MARTWGPSYYAETGEQRWRFHTVPGNPADGFESKAMAMAAKTWNGEWWKHGGGGTVWQSITYDPEFNRIYLGTGNGAPWNQRIRSPGGGDNLFLCAIVALDADTGEYAWHYQTVPGETWDYNSSMDIVLADLELGGQPRKVLMHAPKNGFFYVLDRENGKLLSAEKWGKVTWAERVDLATGRPVEADFSRYEDGEELVGPGPIGAHNWHPMSFNPKTGLVYLPYQELPGYYNDKGFVPKTWTSTPFTPALGVQGFVYDIPADAGWSALVAWDPIANTEAWKVRTPGVWNPGTLTTAGMLVFQGRADGRFLAYDATSGEALWKFDTGLGITAPPMTYSVDGRQYVALLVGWGAASASLLGTLTDQHGWQYGLHPRRLLVFALDGSVRLPPMPAPSRPPPINNPMAKIDTELAEAGRAVFGDHCAVCHGSGGAGGGYTPDLRASPIAADLAALPDLGEDDLKSLHQFIRLIARERAGQVSAGK